MTGRLFHIVKLFVNPLKLLLFARLVDFAYRHPGKSAHRLIKAVGRKWYGIERCGEPVSAWCHWFMDCIFQAQSNVFKARISAALDLGAEYCGVASRQQFFFVDAMPVRRAMYVIFFAKTISALAHRVGFINIKTKTIGDWGGDNVLLRTVARLFQAFSTTQNLILFLVATKESCLTV